MGTTTSLHCRIGLPLGSVLGPPMRVFEVDRGIFEGVRVLAGDRGGVEVGVRRFGEALVLITGILVSLAS